MPYGCYHRSVHTAAQEPNRLVHLSKDESLKPAVLQTNQSEGATQSAKQHTPVRMGTTL